MTTFIAINIRFERRALVILLRGMSVFHNVSPLRGLSLRYIWSNADATDQ